MSEQAPFYIFTAFIFAYAVGTLKMSRDLILSAVMVAACVSFITIPLSGHISDRIGRKRMYLIGVVTMGLFGFLYFGMVDTAIPSAVFIAIVLSLIPHDIQYGPQAALIAESFTPRLRYSGASLGYQLASIIAGGPSPMIATALFATYQVRLRDRDLYRRLRCHQPDSDLAHARLHGQGHFGRIRRLSVCRAKISAPGFSRPGVFISAIARTLTAPRRSADRSGACGLKRAKCGGPRFKANVGRPSTSSVNTRENTAVIFSPGSARRHSRNVAHDQKS